MGHAWDVGFLLSFKFETNRLINEREKLVFVKSQFWRSAVPITHTLVTRQSLPNMLRDGAAQSV